MTTDLSTMGTLRMSGDVMKISSKVLDRSVFIHVAGNGPITEVRIYCNLAGSDVEARLYEEAALLSLALQRGIKLSDVADLVERNADGSPRTVFGEVFDAVSEHQSGEQNVGSSPATAPV